MTLRREMTDNTTMAEAVAMHHADQPECLEHGRLALHAEGVGCPRCGWLLVDPDLAVTPPS